MADYKDNGSEKKGKVIYNIGIVKGIVRLAVEDVAGVAIQYRKRTVRKSTDGISDVAYDIQRNIKHSVEAMSKYKIGNIDVKVNGVIFPDENAAV